MRKFITAIGTLTLFAAAAGAQSARIVVDDAKPCDAIGKDMYGIFFEKINHAGEGGIYGELIGNRDFEAVEGAGGAKVEAGRDYTLSFWAKTSPEFPR